MCPAFTRESAEIAGTAGEQIATGIRGDQIMRHRAVATGVCDECYGRISGNQMDILATSILNFPVGTYENRPVSAAATASGQIPPGRAPL